MTEDPSLTRWVARRQFAVAVLVLLGSAGLLWAGRIDGTRWADVTIWTVGLYMLGEAAGAWAPTFRRTP